MHDLGGKHIVFALGALLAAPGAVLAADGDPAPVATTPHFAFYDDFQTNLNDALLVDVRSETQRACDGAIPGAIWHPRNVLEWRVDPASTHADPRLSGDLDRTLVIVCNEGYQSSLAAATLQDLGFANATDLIGGFQAWRAAGLAVQAATDAEAVSGTR